MKKIDFKIERPMTEEEKRAIVILKTLQRAGFKSYFVGGGVRDELMGNPAHDIDIATSAKPEEIEKLFSHSYDRGKKFGVMAVRSGKFEFEVATFRSDIGTVDHRRPEKIEFTNAEEDAKRRDFTINGLFYNPEKSQIIDYVGGVEDLKNKIIRFIGKPQERIDEDYLRMLRAVRFANRFGFALEDESRRAIIKNAQKIKEVSVERVREEISKMLTNKNRVKSLKTLSELKLLEQILPELEQLQKVEQPPEFHREGDVWTHTLLAMENLPDDCPEVLAWTVLLHDIAKPETQGFREHPKSKITFFEHDILSAQKAAKILRKFKFSNDFTEVCAWIISQHMRIINAFREGDQQMSERKQEKLFLDPRVDLLLEATYADLSASLRPDKKPNLSMYENALARKKYFQNKPEDEKKQLKKFDLIAGNDIMKILKIKPGPKVGEIKKKIEEAFLEGKISSRVEALEMIKKQDASDNLVRDTYNKIAEKYHQCFGQNSKFLVRNAEEFIKLLPQNGKILDLGCGTGRDAKYFAAKGLKVTGVDFSKAMLEIARKMVPRAEFLENDIRKLDLGKREFDGIWISFSLLHLKKIEVLGFLEKIKKFLARDGVLFMATKEGVGEHLEKEHLDSHLLMFESFWSEKELKDLVKKAGYNIISVKIDTDRYESGEKIIVIFARK